MANVANKKFPASKLGVQEELCEFFRVVKIRQSDNPEYVILTVVEADKLKFQPLGVNTPYHVDRLRNQWFGSTYLRKGMTSADVDPDTLVSLHDLVHGKVVDGEQVIKPYLSDDDNIVDIDVDFYLYNAQVERYTTTEQPSDSHKLVDIVDDNGKVIEKNVYRVTRLVGLDGVPYATEE